MRRTRALLPVLTGPLLGALIWAALKLATPASAGEVADDWVDFFRAEGFDARLRSVSRQPERHFALVDRRPEFEEPELAGTVLRSIEISRLNIQIAEFPTVDAAGSILDRGRTEIRERLFRETLVWSIHRTGRRAAIVLPVRQTFGGRENASAELANRILDAFARRAETLP